MDGLGTNLGDVFGCIDVPESRVGISKYKGKDNVLEPGCYCLPWCLGYHYFGILSLGIQEIRVAHEVKTKDEFLVSAYTTIQARPIRQKAVRAHFNRLVIQEPLLSLHVYKTIKAMVHQRMTLDEVFEHKAEIAHAVMEALEPVVGVAGYKLHKIYVDIEEGRIPIPQRRSDVPGPSICLFVGAAMAQQVSNTGIYRR